MGSNEEFERAKKEYEEYVREHYRRFLITDLITGEILEEVKLERVIDAVIYASERYEEYGKKVAVLENSCTAKIKRVGHVGYTKKGGTGATKVDAPGEYVKRSKKLNRVFDIPGQLSLRI